MKNSTQTEQGRPSSPDAGAIGTSFSQRSLFRLLLLLVIALMTADCGGWKKVIEDIAEAATPADLAWASRRDLTSQSFSNYFDDYRDRGWIIKDVDAYPDGNSTRYAMIWEENPDNRGWAEWRNLTSDGYHEKWEEYRDKGYRPTDVEGYLSGNNLRFAGIWEENKEGFSWYSRRGLTGSEYGDLFDEKSGEGFRLVDMEAYQTSSGLRYACIWYENTTNIQWAQYRDMSREKYQERIDQFSADGYRVIDFESYTADNGNQRYAAIWEKNTFDHATVVRSNRTEIEYANYWRLYRDLGYRLIDFERYETSSGTRYAGVWTENSPRYRWNKKGEIDNLVSNYQSTNNIPGISVAIVHEGKLVYQRGFGKAEVDRDKDAHGRSVYLAASVAKVIGGTLAAKMESEGQLADGTSVTLDLTAPVTNYLAIPAAGHTYTVDQILSHLGCLWHYSGPTPSGHFNTALDAVDDIWNNPTLSGCTIGTNRNYSTHAFSFVGAVLESVSGRSIAQLVEEEIADRYGFNSMRVQYRTSSLPSNYERAAPYNDSGNETSYSNNSWKVLGGGIEVDAVDLAWFGWKTLDGVIVNATTRDNRLWTRVNPSQQNGLAWSLTTVGGRQVAEHGGSWSGARSHLRVYRDAGDELVVAILSNQRGHSPSTLATSIGNAVLD